MGINGFYKKRIFIQFFWQKVFRKLRKKTAFIFINNKAAGSIGWREGCKHIFNKQSGSQKSIYRKGAYLNKQSRSQKWINNKGAYLIKQSGSQRESTPKMLSYKQSKPNQDSELRFFGS